MKRFIAFLIVSLAYYSLLTRSSGSKPVRNILAFAMAFVFSSAFVLCFIAFARHPMDITAIEGWIMFSLIAYLLLFRYWFNFLLACVDVV